MPCCGLGFVQEGGYRGFLEKHLGVLPKDIDSAGNCGEVSAATALSDTCRCCKLSNFCAKLRLFAQSQAENNDLARFRLDELQDKHPLRTMVNCPPRVKADNLDSP